jgi:hypothetical protein
LQFTRIQFPADKERSPGGALGRPRDYTAPATQIISIFFLSTYASTDLDPEKSNRSIDRSYLYFSPLKNLILDRFDQVFHNFNQELKATHNMQLLSTGNLHFAPTRVNLLKHSNYQA